MAKKRSKFLTITYEPEADVLMWEITHEPIDYATEVGNMVIHFTKRNTPVLVEILNARNFLKQGHKLVGENVGERIARFAVA